MSKKMDYSIEYVLDKSMFSIRCSEGQIIIRIQDRKNSKESEIVIDNVVLRRQAMTVADLTAEIYKQSVHQGRNKKHLLSFDDSSITLSFTYPKCQIKPITFSCNWDHTQKSSQEAYSMLVKAQRTLENFDERSRLNFEKVATYVDSKLASTLKALTKHYNQLIKRLNDEMHQKAIEFNMMLNQGKAEEQERFKILLKEAIERILESNHRYYDQFSLMKTNIQTDILLCDQNIKEISNQFSDLRSFMMAEHEKMEDQIIKVNVDFKGLQKNMRYQFKEIKAILQEKATLQVDLKQVNLKKYAISETIENKAVHQEMYASVGVGGLMHEDNEEVEEEKPTSLPILHRKQLSQLPLSTQMYLSEPLISIPEY